MWTKTANLTGNEQKGDACVCMQLCAVVCKTNVLCNLHLYMTEQLHVKPMTSLVAAKGWRYKFEREQRQCLLSVICILICQTD